MTPQYILRKSLCREPWCAHESGWRRTAQMIIDNLVWASEYVEPGYDAPRKGILFADWNYFPAKVADLLESYGYTTEWEDEWSVCDDCYRAVRTQPDSWSWRPSYTLKNEGEIVCVECDAETRP